MGGTAGNEYDSGIEDDVFVDWESGSKVELG